jgi:hypothetical protein
LCPKAVRSGKFAFTFAEIGNLAWRVIRTSAHNDKAFLVESQLRRFRKRDYQVRATRDMNSIILEYYILRSSLNSSPTTSAMPSL